MIFDKYGARFHKAGNKQLLIFQKLNFEMIRLRLDLGKTLEYISKHLGMTMIITRSQHLSERITGGAWPGAC